MNSISPIDFCRAAIFELKETQDFAKTFLRLKRGFFNKYQAGEAYGKHWREGFIFSTRFGLDFFTETLNRLEKNSPITPDKGQSLYEYDLNYNKWLEIWKVN